MQLAQALRLKGDVAAADVYVDRVRRLNRVYNLIVRVRSPGRENQVSDLTELGKACEDAGLIDEARGWYGRAIAVNPLDEPAQQGLHRLGRSADGSRSSIGPARSLRSPPVACLSEGRHSVSVPLGGGTDLAPEGAEDVHEIRPGQRDADGPPVERHAQSIVRRPP